MGVAFLIIMSILMLGFMSAIVVEATGAREPLARLFRSRETKALEAKSVETIGRFMSMSKGARMLLSLQDPTTDTGFFEGMKEEELREHMDYREYLRYRRDHSILRRWADADYNYSPKNLKRISAKENPFEKRRLMDSADIYEFDLSNITSDEWELIIQRYMWHVKDIHNKHVGELPELSDAAQRHRRQFNELAAAEDAKLEITRGDGDDPRSVWESRFNDLNSEHVQESTVSRFRRLLG